ncbi:MAG: type VI secretion system tip protein VgrG [Polyangiaceae bacterium]|nr:type VI secretion system tip protein VgrG [Polyangiaceae bacterium]
MNGNDFQFAVEGMTSVEGPWKYLRVVRASGEEAMSRLFRYEVIALLKGDDADPQDFVGKRASLRIATLSEPAYRLVHGVVTEAEDAGLDAQGPIYRIVVEPPLVRARYRKRYRIFLDKTLRRIIETVLQADAGMALVSGSQLEPPTSGPTYQPAAERFTWRISSSARLDDPKARPYVVQYGESDLDFVSRLLEEEGISYHFEHNDDASLLVLSDKDFGRPRVPFDDTFGPGKAGRAIGQFRVGGRLRASSVQLGEYNWEKPAADMSAKANAKAGSDLSEYSYPGGYLESAELGKPLAFVKVEALHTEASFAHGQGTTRVLAPGAIFTLEHPKARYDGEYLVTGTLVRAYQHGVLSVDPPDAPAEPYHVQLQCACRGRGKDVSESLFRPPRSTPKPRIFGTQTAFVTAEPGAAGEINIGGPGSIGCVRVAFHWDTEKSRLAKEPSSKWVRVSEPFARGGQGGIWHPRIGTEVIVEFEEGDPDRPVVTGRVYNGKNRPAQTAPTHSTMWSLSTPGGGVRNEISFEDTAGSERIYTNAGKNMTADVGNNRTENVGANAFMTVGSNDTELIGANQTIQIGGNDTLDVGANQTETIGANQSRVIGGSRTMMIGGNETRKNGANHANVVGAALNEGIGGNVLENYGAARSTSIGAAFTEEDGATRTQSVGGLVFQQYGGNHTTTVGGNREIKTGGMQGELVGGSVTTDIAASETVDIGATAIHIAGGPITHQAASMDLNMLAKVHLIGVKLNMFVADMGAYGSSSAYGVLRAAVRGSTIEAAGFKIEKTGLKLDVSGVKRTTDGARLAAVGVLIHPSGMHVKT